MFCVTGEEGGKENAQAGCWAKGGYLHMAIHGMYVHVRIAHHTCFITVCHHNYIATYMFNYMYNAHRESA